MKKQHKCYRCGQPYIRNSNGQKYCGNRKKKGSCSYLAWTELVYERQKKLWKTPQWKVKMARHRKAMRARNPIYWKSWEQNRKGRNKAKSIK